MKMYSAELSDITLYGNNNYKENSSPGFIVTVHIQYKITHK